MEKGYINHFDFLKGYGFIRREKGRDLIFSSDDLPESHSLIEIPKGLKVEFETIKTNKGPRAIKILIV